MSCDDCDCFYLGQTGRSFLKRYKEHLPRNDLDKTKSNYARHLMMHNQNHTDFNTNFKAIHVCGKGRLLDALEEFEIYKSFKDKNINNNPIEQFVCFCYLGCDMDLG